MTTMTTDTINNPTMRSVEAIAIIELLIAALAERPNHVHAMDAFAGSLAAHRDALLGIPLFECPGLTIDDACWGSTTGALAEVEGHLAGALDNNLLPLEHRRVIAGARLALAVIRLWFEGEEEYRGIRRRRRPEERRRGSHQRRP